MSKRPAEPVRDLSGDSALSGTLRQDLLRANTAVAIVLIAVLTLALVAVFASLRAAHNLRRAESAESKSAERLRIGYTEEARAIRISAVAGGRAAAIGVISNAVAISPSPELRTEAIACLALSDLVQEAPLVPTPKGLPRVEMDSQLRFFACGDLQGNVVVHSLVDGRELFKLNDPELGGGPGHRAYEIAFSPDGQLLAARFINGAVVVWNVDTRQPVFTNGLASPDLPPSLQSTGLAFSPDSRRLIISELPAQGRISVFDVPSGQRLSSAVDATAKTFRMRPDLKQVAVVTGDCVDIMDYPSGTNVQTLLNAARVETIEWSPDSRHLAVSCDDGDVCLWEPVSDAQRHFTGHSERCVRLNFSHDGKLLFSSSRDGTTRLWDVTLGRMIAVGEGMGNVFTPDGLRIGFWRPWDGFGVWRVSSSAFYAVHECDKNAGPLLSLDLSPDGRWCVATQKKGFRIWDLASGDRAIYVPESASGVRVAMDGHSLFVCCDRGLELWPLSTNAGGAWPPADVKKIPLPDGQGARAVALSLDGRWALVELLDQRLVNLDLSGARPPVVLQGRWRSVNLKGAASPTGAGRFAISPDGRWIATGFNFSADGPEIWDGTTGARVASLPADTSVVGFSPDGRWLGLSGMSRNSVWSVGDWRLQKEFPRDESSLVHGALAFGPDGRLLVLSRKRQVLQLRDWPSDAEMCDLISPVAQSVNTVRFSSDGSTLVTATASDMLEVWRLGALRRTLAGMNLDWGVSVRPAAAARPPGRFDAGSWQVIALTCLGAFFLITILALLILRRHRIAIERFVAAEARTAQRNRELDLAKVELMHSQKMQALGTLATGIAHDFNNLLSVVRMSGKLIGRRAVGDAEIQEHVTDIEQAVLSGKSVVSSVLGYAGAEKNRGDLIDVGAVVDETVSLLSREFLSGIKLTLELERDTARVALTRSSLEQLLLNLLVNASEAMQGAGSLKIILHARSSPPPGHYVLWPQPSPHYLELSVVDSGPGIAPEIRERLFEPFFTTKRSGVKPGTGLGLSLVYSIAQQIGLGLGVESEPSRGAKFTLLIPVAAPPVRETHSAKVTGPV